MNNNLERYDNTEPLNIIDLFKYFWIKKIYILIPFFLSLIISLIVYFSLADKFVYKISLEPMQADQINKFISDVEVKIPNIPNNFNSTHRQPLSYSHYASSLITNVNEVLSNGKLFHIYIDKLLIKLKNKSINKLNIIYEKKSKDSYIFTLTTEYEEDYDKMVNFFKLPNNLFNETIIKLYDNRFNNVKKELQTAKLNLKKMEDDLKAGHDLVLKYKINFLKKHLEVAKKLQIKEPIKQLSHNFNDFFSITELFDNDEYYSLGSNIIESQLENLTYFHNSSENNYKLSIEFINLQFRNNYYDNYLKQLNLQREQIVNNIEKTDMLFYNINSSNKEIIQLKETVITIIILLGLILPFIYLLINFSIFSFKAKI